MHLEPRAIMPVGIEVDEMTDNLKNAGVKDSGMMMSKTHGHGSASGKIGLQAGRTKAEVDCPAGGFLFTHQPGGRLLGIMG